MIAKQCGVLIAAVDLESSMWKVAREMFIILQEELNVSKRQINEVDIEAIKDVLEKIGQLKNMVDKVKGKNSKVQTISKEIDGNLIDLKDLVKTFEKELRSAITGDNHKMDSCVQGAISNGNGKEKPSQKLVFG